MSRVRKEQKRMAIAGLTTTHVVRVVEGNHNGQLKVGVFAPGVGLDDKIRLLQVALEIATQEKAKEPFATCPEFAHG